MYRTVDTALWTDPKVRQLDPQAKLAFLYLITNPHAHVGGIYYLLGAVAQQETGLSQPEWDRVCDTLSGLGLARFDKKRDVIWVVNMMIYQARGDKANRAAAAALHSLHNSPLIKEFLRKYPAVKRLFSGRVSHRVSDRVSEFGTQDQDQDQDQDKNTPPPPPGGGRLAPVPASLDTPAFRAAWADWIQHRRERKPRLTPKSAEGALAELAEWGPERAVAAIRRSIAKGWQGIHEDTGHGPANGTPRPDRDDEDDFNPADYAVSPERAAEMLGGPNVPTPEGES